MASDCCDDDSVFDFPPLFQTMKLDVEGGPMYRGGRSGRAAVAYYREKEVMIAMKNKYGNRYGRRIQYYKPDNEAWKPERYQRHVGTLNSRTSEVIPGGLQNKKTLLHVNREWLAQTAARGDQQTGISLRAQASTKYSSETIKSDGVLETDHRTSHTLDLAELGRPTKSGRGVMRGKRVVDLFAVYCEDENEALTVSPEKREPEISLQEDKGNVRNCNSNQSPSEHIETDEKHLAVSPEKREPEISQQKDKGNVRNCDSNQSPSELIETDEKEQLAVIPEKRESEISTNQDQGNTRNNSSNQSASELINSDSDHGCCHPYNNISFSLQSETKVLSKLCQGVHDAWEDVSLSEPQGYQATSLSKQPYTIERQHSCGPVIPIPHGGYMDGTKSTTKDEGHDLTSNTQTSGEEVPVEIISTSGAGGGLAQEVENLTEKLDKVRIKHLSWAQKRKLLKEKMIKEGKEWLPKHKWRELKGLKPKT